MKVFRNVLQFRGFSQSIKYAMEGIVYLILFHRNMRIIFILGLVALIAGLYYRLKGIELIALCISVTLVFMAEIFNTAIELIIDMFTEKYNTRIKLVKDISAAVALIAVFNAIAIGIVIFGKRIF
ncbi:MAG: diacylglycerol kinase family protein [Candidatus Omnitrophota bacterium]